MTSDSKSDSLIAHVSSNLAARALKGLSKTNFNTENSKYYYILFINNMDILFIIPIAILGIIIFFCKIFQVKEIKSKPLILIIKILKWSTLILACLSLYYK